MPEPPKPAHLPKPQPIHGDTPACQCAHESDKKLRDFALLVRQGCLLIAKGIERQFLDDQRKDKAA